MDYSLAFTLLLIVLLGGCAPSTSFEVRTDYDKKQKQVIQGFRTYDVVQPTQDIIDQMQLRDPAVLEVIAQGIREEMEKRGYRQSDTPDVQITYFVNARQFTQGQQKGGMNVGMGFGGYYGSVGMSTNVGGRIEYIDYVAGTLIIDMFTGADSDFIWHGAAQGTFRQGMENPRQVAREAVQRIFYKYSFKVKG